MVAPAIPTAAIRAIRYPMAATANLRRPGAPAATAIHIRNHRHRAAPTPIRSRAADQSAVRGEALPDRLPMPVQAVAVPRAVRLRRQVEAMLV